MPNPIPEALVAKWREEADEISVKMTERDPDGRFRLAEWVRDRMSAEASAKRGNARELEAALASREPAVQPADWYARREEHARSMGYSGLAAALDDLEHRRGTQPKAAPGAVEEAARLLQAWIDEGECECEGSSHHCGRPNVERTIADLRALASQPVAVDRSP